MIKSRLSYAAAVSAGVVFGGIGPTHGAVGMSPAVGEVPPAQIALPPMHTTIATPEPRRAEPPPRPFEVAGATEMLFDRDSAALGDHTVELAQAGALSVNDWLMREQANPNVRRAPASPTPYPQPPANRDYRATPSYHTYPATQVSPQPHTPPSGAGYRFPASNPWTPPDAPAPPQNADTRTPGFTSSVRSREEAAEDIDAPSRFYIGGGIGYSSFGVDSTSSSVEVEDTTLSFKGFIGYRQNKYLGAELQFAKVGVVEQTHASGSHLEEAIYSVGFSGNISLPLGGGFTPFAKMGIHGWWENAENSGSVSNTEGSGTDLYFGLGVDYNVFRALSIRAEWENYFVADENANVFTASAILNF